MGQQIVSQAQRGSGTDMYIRGRHDMALAGEVDGFIGNAVEFPAKLIAQRAEIRLETLAVQGGDRQVDIACVTAIAVWMERKPVRQEEEFGGRRIDAFIVIEIEQG